MCFKLYNGLIITISKYYIIIYFSNSILMFEILFDVDIIIN